MTRKFTRHDFLIKDLAVSVGAGGRGTWLPGSDDETPPSPISPIASVMVHIDHIEAVRGTIVEALKTQRFDEVARAFVTDDKGGNPVIRTAIQEIGTAVVASAAYAALGGGSVGLPNPECDGTSTIPPTLTPIVHIGRAVHKVTELPRLRQQLAQSIDYVEKVAAAQAPHGEEVGVVRAQLESALKNLR